MVLEVPELKSAQLGMGKKLRVATIRVVLLGGVCRCDFGIHARMCSNVVRENVWDMWESEVCSKVHGAESDLSP